MPGAHCARVLQWRHPTSCLTLSFIYFLYIYFFFPLCKPGSYLRLMGPPSRRRAKVNVVVTEAQV